MRLNNGFGILHFFRSTFSVKGRFFIDCVTAGAVALAIYQLLQAFVVTQSSISMNLVHVTATIILVCLSYATDLVKASKTNFRKSIFICVLLFFALVSFSYLWLQSARLEVDWPWISNTDMIAGLCLFFTVAATTWLAWGPVLSMVGVCGILYFIFGNYLPGLLGHPGVSSAYAISYLGMSLKTGMFWLVPLSVNAIFPLMVFGMVIRATRATEAFNELMKAAGKISIVAPVYTCVVESGLVGMVTGGPVTNVVLTGSVTIPAMKSIGLRPETAGGLEAISSTGSQIVPPILGLAAFVMAEMIGVSYITVMKAAILPAVLYYGALVISAYFVSSNELGEYKGKISTKVDWKKCIRLFPTFIIPLGTIIVLLFNGFSPLYVSGWGTLIALALSQTQGKFRPSLRELAGGLKEGAVLGSQVAVILMSVGFLGQSLLTTGLGLRLNRLLTMLTGSSLSLSLVMIMVVALIIGMGAPTIVAYILSAIAVVPAVQDLGVNVLVANFFALYFASFSHMTPPVAASVFAACRLAGSKFLKTAWQAVKLAWPLFLVPFCFTFHPEILGVSPMTRYTGFVVFIYFVSVICGVGAVWKGLPELRMGLMSRGMLAISAISGVGYICNEKAIYLVFLLVSFLFGWGGALFRKMIGRKSRSNELNSVA